MEKNCITSEFSINWELQVENHCKKERRKSVIELLNCMSRQASLARLWHVISPHTSTPEVESGSPFKRDGGTTLKAEDMVAVKPITMLNG